MWLISNKEIKYSAFKIQTFHECKNIPDIFFIDLKWNQDIKGIQNEYGMKNSWLSIKIWLPNISGENGSFVFFLLLWKLDFKISIFYALIFDLWPSYLSLLEWCSAATTYMLFHWKMGLWWSFFFTECIYLSRLRLSGFTSPKVTSIIIVLPYLTVAISQFF